LRRSSIVISSPAATAPSSVTFSFEGTVAAPVTFYVSEYEGLRKATVELYNHPDFKVDAAVVLNLRPVDIHLKYGALNVLPALTELRRL
jgi:hypothetical protein